MAKVIKMPVLGQSVEEVRILQWFKAEGDPVQQGEKIAEIETDKTNMDFESPESGIVRRLLATPDSYVKVEEPILIIGTADEPIDDLLPEGAPALNPIPSPNAGMGARTAISPRARRAADQLGVNPALLSGRGTGPHGRVQEKDVLALHQELIRSADPMVEARGPKASPLARAVASDAGLDLGGVSGTGMGGRITAEDVRSAAQPAPSILPSLGTRLRVIGRGDGGEGATRTVMLTGLRKRVADNLVRSIRNAPHVTLNTQADMAEAMRLRAELLPPIEKATGVRLSPTDIIVKACAVALSELSYVNAHIDGDALTLFDDVHIGLAVSLGEGGLIVPVIRDVGRKGLAQIARDRQDLATRARANKLASAEVTGGTFTVTNLGNYGIESFNPIIAPPQVAILGVGAIADAVVARDGVPTVRPMMGLSLSFDHRAMDGAPAAAFLARVREILESPYLLLL
jgi:pyruvate dehydrogenase E2 component (dihydrolipoamide acetyltransferase)